MMLIFVFRKFRYRGPELEVWSMGITLYTLVFGENPFYDVEETIKAELRPPFRVSAGILKIYFLFTVKYCNYFEFYLFLNSIYCKIIL